MRISKLDLKEHARLINLLDDKWNALENMLQEYSDILDEARQFSQNVAQSLQDEFDSKSDRWQESDKGQSAQELISQWENFWPDDCCLDPAHEEFKNLPIETEDF